MIILCSSSVFSPLCGSLPVFALTVVASIPLCVFSSRNSLDSLITTYFVTVSMYIYVLLESHDSHVTVDTHSLTLLSSSAQPSKPVINGPARIPNKRFFSITAVLVGGALLIALYIPNGDY